MAKYRDYVSFFFLIFYFFPVSVSSYSIKPSTKAYIDAEQISLAVERYKVENGNYPSNAEGLIVLVGNENSPNKGMIRRLPLDPWGNDYIYRYPGKINKESFDVLSYGADAKEGGSDLDTDCGNWSSDYCETSNSSPPPPFIVIVYAAASGFILGLPLYLLRAIQLYSQSRVIKAALVGFHFYMVLYLIAIFVLFSLMIPSII